MIKEQATLLQIRIHPAEEVLQNLQELTSGEDHSGIQNLIHFPIQVAQDTDPNRSTGIIDMTHIDTTL